MVVEDWLYPDNPSRLARLQELSVDCGQLTIHLSDSKSQIEHLMEGANAAIVAVYKDKLQKSLDYQEVVIGDKSWVISVATPVGEALIAYFTYNKFIEGALQAAFVAAALRRGALGGAAFAGMVGFPPWYAVGKFAAGTAITVGIQIAITLVVDSINGAVERSRLRDGITSLVSPRIELQQRFLINEKIKETLRSLITAFEMFSVMDGITEAQVTAAVKKLIEKHKNDLDTITRDYAIHTLAKRDAERNSWTAEDYWV